MSAPEYCFLWIDWWPFCMNKAEWAAWAGAIGATGAVAVAVWLPARARAEARIDAEGAAISFGAQLVATTAQFARIVGKGPLYQAKAHLQVQHDACALSSGIRPELIGSHSFRFVMGMRNITLLHCAELMQEDAPWKRADVVSKTDELHDVLVEFQKQLIYEVARRRSWRWRIRTALWARKSDVVLP